MAIVYYCHYCYHWAARHLVVSYSTFPIALALLSTRVPGELLSGGGDDTLGNPHRAQISQFEFFELKLFNSSFSSSSTYWNSTNSFLSINSRQQYLSQRYPPAPLALVNLRYTGTVTFQKFNLENGEGRLFRQQKLSVQTERLSFQTTMWLHMYKVYLRIPLLKSSQCICYE